MNSGLDRFQRVLQYFWDPEPKNIDIMNSIWCLGQEYPSTPCPSSAPPPHPPPPFLSGPTVRSPEDCGSERNENNSTWPTPFLDDFESRIWLTYRTDFTPIPRSAEPSTMSFTTMLRTQLSPDMGGFTSDVGWGCMIRTGQSLLANALCFHRLGRNWRRGKLEREEKKLLALFADDPRAPFSIHKFVKHGEAACGKQPGEWFGPSAAARCIQALCHEYPELGIKVYITGDGSEVYENSFKKIAIDSNGVFTPTLVLVGIRLGIDRVTPVYWEALKNCVQMPQSVGIAGGRPSSSHYFVGVQGQTFFYLDPHQQRPSLPYKADPSKYTLEDVDSCHTRRLRKLHLKEMDPSMLLGFLIRDENDWKEWRKAVGQVQGKPVVHVSDIEPNPYGGSTGGPREEAVAEVEALDDEDDF